MDKKWIKIRLIVEIDSIIYTKSEQWLFKIKNTYSKHVIWDSYYLWPYNIRKVQKSELDIYWIGVCRTSKYGFIKKN